MSKPAKTIKEVLIATRWILQHAGWCQGDSGRDMFGNSCSPHNPACVSRCLTGAIHTVVAEYKLRHKAFQQLTQEVSGSPIRFNDAPGRTKQQMLDLLDRAIQRLS